MLKFVDTLIYGQSGHEAGVVYWVAIKGKAGQNESSVSYSFLRLCFHRDEETDPPRE